MVNNHTDLEDTLRSLPTATPPADVRSRIFAAVEQQAPRRSMWRRGHCGRLRGGLALTLGLLLLICIDIGVCHIQDARIASLLGPQPEPTVAPMMDHQFALAFAQQQAFLNSLTKGDLR